MSTGSISNGPTIALQPCALQRPLGEGAHRRPADGSPKSNSFVAELRKSGPGELFDLDASRGRAEAASDVPAVMPFLNVAGMVATLTEDRGGNVEEALAATSIEQPRGAPSETSDAAKARHAGKAACASESDPNSHSIHSKSVSGVASSLPTSGASVTGAPERFLVESGHAPVASDGRRPEVLVQRPAETHGRQPKRTTDDLRNLAVMPNAQPLEAGEPVAADAGGGRLLQVSRQRPGAGDELPDRGEHHRSSSEGSDVSPYGFSGGGFLDFKCVDDRQDGESAPAAHTSSTVEIAKQTSPRQISLVLRSETSAEIGVELRIASGKAHVGIVASADDAWMIRTDQTQLENKILTSTGLSAEVTVSVHGDQSAASMTTGDDGKFGFEPRGSTRDEEAGRGQTPHGTVDQDRGEGRRRDRREADRARVSDRRLLL